MALMIDRLGAWNARGDRLCEEVAGCFKSALQGGRSHEEEMRRRK